MDLGIAAVTGGSAVRSVVAAVFAVAAAIVVAQELRRSSTIGRRVLWVMLVAVVLSPDIVTGYAYSNFSLSLIRDPVWNEAFLTLLIGLKATAVAAVMLYFTPAPSLSPSGRHLLRLARGRIDEFDRSSIIGRGVVSRGLPAAAVAFLLAFQQFELPSLTAAPAWTVTLFDRQALVPDPATSARSLVWPLAVELVVLAPVLLFVLRATGSHRDLGSPQQRRGTGRYAAWLAALLAVLLTVVVPMAVLVREGMSGLGFIVGTSPAAISYWHEIAVSLGYGVSSAVIAGCVAIGLLRLVSSPRWRTAGVILLTLACVPGLCGPLVPSLVAVAWLQSPLLLPLRDTTVPLVVVLSLTLLPRAVLMEALARLIRPATGMHLVNRLRASPVVGQRTAARRLTWELEGYGRYCRFSLLAYWGYLDLTAATILAPPGVVPVTARLYNLMHYGHNASLSAMALVAVMLPAVVFATLLLVRKLSLASVRE